VPVTLSLSLSLRIFRDMHKCWTKFWASHILGAFGKAQYSGLHNMKTDGIEAGINLRNYRIFSPNMKTDGIEAQLYPDRFPQHPIPF
jgi:hypothetical protein